MDIFERYTKDDKDLIQKTFKDPYVQLALRNLFLGFPLSDDEETLIKSVNTPLVRKVLRKVFYPEIEKDTPVMMEIDVWMTFQINSLQEYPIVVEAIEKVKAMVDMAFAYLENLSGPRPSIELPNNPNHSDIRARNMYISKIVQAGFLTLGMIINNQQETPAQIAARQKKDSMK